MASVARTIHLLSRHVAAEGRSCLARAAYKGSSSFFHESRTTTILRRRMSDLPHHLVVGMPALSPTMQSGTLSEWKIEEGSPFQAGDSLAEIQTDKASIAFEAQDDGFIAKYLVPAGTEVNVGDPIMVTVEDGEFVKAFANFVPPAKAPETPPAPSTPKEQHKAVSAAPSPPATPSPPAPVASPLPPAPPIVVPTPPVLAEPIVAASTLALPSTPMWGKLAKKASPIAKTLSSTQQKYIDLYGPTGQSPL